MNIFPEDLIIRNTTNTKLIIFQDGVDFRRNVATVFRMMLVGVLGIALNTISILFLYSNPSIKVSLKITLMGMTLNDLCYTINSVVQGQPQWNWVSESPHCWPTVFFVVAPTLLSYFITINLAMHNFVAVVYPFHCDQIMSKLRSFWLMVMCWVTAYLLVLAFLGMKFPKGFMCLTMNVMPRTSMAVVASFCVASCGVIVGLNVVIGVKVRDSVKILKKDKTLHGKDHPRKRGDAKETPECPENYQSHHGQAKDNLHDVLKEGYTKGLVNGGYRASTESLTVGDHNIGKEELSLCFSEHPRILKGTNARTQIIEPLSNTKSSFSKMSSPNDSHPSNLTGQANTAKISQNLRCEILHKAPTSSIAGINKARLSNSTNNHGRLRRVRTSVTLMLLTIWSCSISLPLVVVIIYVAILAPDRQLFLNTEAGYALSLTGTIHSVGNPLLYGLRFINWSRVRRRINSHLDSSTRL